MPGVLLDHVQVDHPQRHDLVGSLVDEGVVQGCVGRGRVGELELLGQPGVVGGGPVRVGALEVGIRLIPERGLDGLAREPPPEPDAFHLGHVAHQPEQRQVRRRHRALGELLAGQPGALVEQRLPLPVQERLQHQALRAGQRPLRPFNVWSLPCHRPILPCSGYERGRVVTSTVPL
jgi:hypothetical protein